MKSSNREEIIEHNAKELFDIVLDIESYPYFIPWCSAMKVHSKSDKEIYADMIVWYKYFMPQKQAIRLDSCFGVLKAYVDIGSRFGGPLGVHLASTWRPNDIQMASDWRPEGLDRQF